jgi:DNA-binding NtrC family response regulator
MAEREPDAGKREEPNSVPPTGEEPGGRSVLLLDTDLFFSVKITDTLKHAGYTTATVRGEADFARALAERPPAVALVNTAARGIDFRRAIRLACDAEVPIIAFGSHVDVRTQEEARQAGATRVIANSRLAGDLPGVLERALRQSATGGPHVTEADLDGDDS